MVVRVAREEGAVVPGLEVGAALLLPLLPSLSPPGFFFVVVVVRPGAAFVVLLVVVEVVVALFVRAKLLFEPLLLADRVDARLPLQEVGEPVV